MELVQYIAKIMIVSFLEAALTKKMMEKMLVGSAFNHFFDDGIELEILSKIKPPLIDTWK